LISPFFGCVLGKFMGRNPLALYSVIFAMAQLTALQIKNWMKSDMFHDGGGLYLQIKSSGSKSWIYRYFSNGKSYDHGLGPCKALSPQGHMERQPP